MHDFGTIISALGGLIGSLIVAYNAWGNHHTSNFQQSIKTLQDEINQKQADAETYRDKWLLAEKGNDELRRKISRLQNEIEKLKNEDRKKDKGD